MKNIAIIKDGVVENLIAVEPNTRSLTRDIWEAKGYVCINDAEAGPGDLWDGTKFSKPVVEETVPELRTKMSRLEFMNKFTNDELMTIYLLAKTEIALEVWLDKFKLAEYIDVRNPDTVTGIQMMSQVGIISTIRVSEILTGV